MPSSESEATPITIADTFRVVWEHRRRLIIVSAGTFALVLFGLAIYPRSYKSEAKLLVRLGKESVSLDATASFGPIVSMQQSRQTEVNTAKEVLASRAMAERVVDSLGADYVLSAGEGEGSGTGPSITSRIKAALKMLLMVPDISRSEAAIVTLRDAMVVESEDMSSMITLSVLVDNPEFAQMVVRAYCEQFVSEHVRLNHTQESLAFFEAQLEQITESLTAARDAYRNEKNRRSIGSIEDRIRALESQLGVLHSMAQSNEIEAARCQSRIAALSDELEKQDPIIVAEVKSGVANAAADGMRQQFYALEMEEKRLAQKYSNDHPLYQSLRQQMEEAGKIYDEQTKERTEETQAVNEEYRSLNLYYQDERAKLAGCKAARLEIDTQVKKLNSEISELNEHEAELSRLQLRMEDLQRNHRIHAERLEQARVSEELASDQFSNIRIAQPATFEERPASPRVALSLLIGSAFSVLCGLASTLIPLMMTVPLTGYRDAEEQPLELRPLVIRPHPARRSTGGRARSETVVSVSNADER